MTRTVSTRSLSGVARKVPKVISLRKVRLPVVQDYLVHASRQAIGIQPLECMLQLERLAVDTSRYIAIARDCRKRILCLLITAPDAANIQYAELPMPLPFRRALAQVRSNRPRFEVKNYAVTFMITDQAGKVVLRHQYQVQPPSSR